jgi:hypothetical protein
MRNIGCVVLALVGLAAASGFGLYYVPYEALKIPHLKKHF